MNIWKGSLTVEAAVVVSLTFLVLGALMMAILYLHDQAVMTSLVCEVAVTGSNFIPDEGGSEAAEKVRKEIKKNRFMGSRNLSAAKGIGKQTSSASAAAEYPVPGMFMQYFSGGELQLSSEWSCQIQDPADFIRKIRGVELLVDTLLEDE